MVVCAKLGMHFTACTNKKYFPNEELVAQCRAIAEKTGATITLTEDAMEGTKGADVIYTDVWVSMGEPDDVWASRIAELTPYQVNTKLMENAGPQVKFMHCLPAFHDLHTKIGKEIHDKFGLDAMEVTDDKTFDFEYRDKDKQFHRECGLTPKEFYAKYIGLNLNDYISLINAPTADKPYYRSYTVQYLGNVAEGRQVRYVNLPIEELKKAAIAQMKDGEPVWFGCDVGKRSTRESGVMDTKIFALEDLFQTDFPMTKAQRLDYGQSLMTHAMVFQGVNIDENGQPNRWRVENSWGPDAGRDGYYTMTDRWFDEYTYQIVVNRKYLPKEVLEAYEQEPIVLKPWDPMGSLA